MLELIGLLAALGAAGFGYVRSRRFVRERLVFVDAAHRRSAPWIAGFGAWILATPVTWLLPLVGGGTALLFGISVGMGVNSGRKKIRRLLAGVEA